jgi:threonine/homoserine/homoserine lactone efflux protein
VLAASEAAFTGLKIAGAAYLLLLAWQAFRAPASPLSPSEVSRNHARLYVRGIVMNVTNPKVAVFFLAFLPQFVDPELGAAPVQIAWLGCLFIAATVLTFGAIACFSASLGAVLRRSPRVQRSMNRLAGCVLVALAARLAASQR